MRRGIGQDEAEFGVHRHHPLSHAVEHGGKLDILFFELVDVEFQDLIHHVKRLGKSRHLPRSIQINLFPIVALRHLVDRVVELVKRSDDPPAEYD